MNWEDERWVRLYTRDTVTWRVIGWQARTVLLHLLRKVDRAGVLDLGGESPEDAVSAVTELPEEVVAAGLAKLVSKGTVTLRDGQVVLPNFLTAQECRQSDKARQRKAREVRRAGVRGLSQEDDNCDAAVTRRDDSVTHRDKESHAVTRGHTVSPTRRDEKRRDETRRDSKLVAAEDLEPERGPEPAPVPPQPLSSSDSQPLSGAPTPQDAPSYQVEVETPTQGNLAPANGIQDSDDTPGLRCWREFENLTAGAAGDWTGSKIHCQRIEVQARKLSGDTPWGEFMRAMMARWVERQRGRSKPLVLRYLASDFAEVAQVAKAELEPVEPAEDQSAKWARQVIEDFEIIEGRRKRCPSDKRHHTRLKANWEKYKTNGAYYDGKAADAKPAPVKRPSNGSGARELKPKDDGWTPPPAISEFANFVKGKV